MRAFCLAHFKGGIGALFLLINKDIVAALLPRDYARRGIEPVKRKGLIANIGFKGTHKQARDTSAASKR